jgi:hypothetical protein
LMSTLHSQLEGSLAIERAIDAQPQFDPTTPMGLIAMAAQRGASVEQMQQLFELKLRMEADEAKKAFHKSFSAFKAEAVRVVKNVSVTDGPLKGKKYADLFGVVNAVTPVLAKHELSHSWKLTRDEKDWMEVTCTISHSLGHSESVSMGAAPDAGPGRNAIQARGSAKSYLERYTLLAATGLAAADTDTDGNAGKGQVEQGEFDRLCDLISAATDVEDLKSRYKSACTYANSKGDEGAVREFENRKNIRYRELKK